MKIKSNYSFNDISNIVLVAAIFLINFSCFSQSAISLDQVINLTVENNPKFRSNLQNLEYSKGSYRVARSEFNTNIILSGQSTKDRTSTNLDGNDSYIESNYWSSSLALSRKISFGTVITPSIGVFNSGQDLLYEQLGQTLANQGSVYLNLQQPILRGLGSGYNTAGMRIAELEIGSQEHSYLFEASSILLQSLTSYVEYIAAQLNLQIQRNTEETMQETVSQLESLVKSDAIPASELVISQSNLENQKTNTALAENRLALSQNAMATDIGITLEEIISLGPAPTEFNLNNSLLIIDDNYTANWQAASLKNRHDYLAAYQQVEQSEIGLDFSKKGMLPNLNLNFGAGYNGIYQANGSAQYYKPLVSNIPGMNYNIGLTFDIAPRYDFQKGQRIQAMALNEAAQADIQTLELEIKKEVKRDCDQIKYLLGAVNSVNKAVEYSKKATENETKKLELGMSTSFNVAILQNSYLNALERQNTLLEQLNRAILQFKFHTGTMLEATGENTFDVNSTGLFVLPTSP